MKYQTKFYIKGTICLIIAILLATVAPILVHKFHINYIEDYMLVVLKFVMLVSCGVYYLFSPKYYKEQVNDILAAFLIYALYIILYTKP